VLEALPQALAVDGQQLAAAELHQPGHPGHEATLELFGLEPGKDPPEGVVGGNPAWQFQKSSEKLQAAFAELFNVRPVLSAAHYSHK